jgi:general secretion pathway protein G
MNKVPARMKKSGLFYNLQPVPKGSTFYNLSPRDRRKAAFTLIELMIVVAILGILAAIVLPEFQSHTQQAKEAAAKDNLRILRDVIERYAIDHNGVPPGYLNDDPTQTPSGIRFFIQITKNNKYMTDMPKNPFNNRYQTCIVNDNDSFPTSAVTVSEGGGYGWIYQPSTKMIKLNKDGVDSEGIPYLNY